MMRLFKVTLCTDFMRDILTYMTNRMKLLNSLNIINMY